jgi:hypothetical protein
MEIDMKNLEQKIEKKCVISYRDRDGTPCYVIPKSQLMDLIKTNIEDSIENCDREIIFGREVVSLKEIESNLLGEDTGGIYIFPKQELMLLPWKTHSEQTKEDK